LSCAGGTDNWARMVECLRQCPQLFRNCTHGDLCPRAGESYARLIVPLGELNCLSEAHGAAVQALRILLAHRNWGRSLEVQHALGRLFDSSHDPPAALAAVAHGVRLAWPLGGHPWECLLWAQLAALVAKTSRDWSSVALRCHAMALALAQIDSKHLELGFEQYAQVGRLPADERGQIRSQATRDSQHDRGATLLEQASRTTIADTDAYVNST
jgi:hypothetical protein